MFLYVKFWSFEFVVWIIFASYPPNLENDVDVKQGDLLSSVGRRLFTLT